MSNIFNNSILTAIIVFIGSLIVLKVFKSILVARLKRLAKKTQTDFDDVLVSVIENIKPPFYFVLSLYLGIQYLSLPVLADRIISILFIIIIVYEVINATQKLIEYGSYKALSREKDDETAKSSIKTISVIVKVILWSIGLILILDNVGVNVTSLIAGLGIGGVAIALALQNILGDLFSSVSILIDKPFKIGDFIVVGKDMGNVEKIGIKTTRIRTLQGEQLVISNTELTTTRVQNFKLMKKRRVVFELGVIYETKAEKLKQIPEIIKNIINQTDNADFDRCHFKSYGDFSLNFETAYHVLSGDYNDYMDTHQKVNLAIFDAFKKDGIEFAYPTQVEYQKKY
ncbi:mechanosensitive ion channel family protein [Patescibacteria group bacterium]